MQKLTKEQAALIGLYTGVTCGPFIDIHALAEKVIGRPLYAHEFACKNFAEKLKELVREDFLSICSN